LLIASYSNGRRAERARYFSLDFMRRNLYTWFQSSSDAVTSLDEGRIEPMAKKAKKAAKKKGK
jgi:hypothetical protein